MRYIVLSKELLDFWIERNVKSSVRKKYLTSLKLSTISQKSNQELSFMADCAYVWTGGSKCTTMKWEEFDKLQGRFEYISVRYFIIWLNQPTSSNTNEDQLQRKETHVVRGDDGEGNRVQSRKRKASITVGHLSYKTIKG